MPSPSYCQTLNRLALRSASLAGSCRTRAAYRRDQPVQTDLEQVVRGAKLQRFDRLLFADRARDQDHRDVWLRRLSQLQRTDAIVVGQVVINEDEIEGVADQRRLELLPRVGDDGGAAHPLAFQPEADQLRVPGAVLQVEYTERRRERRVREWHRHGYSAAGPARRGLAGSSLMTAQKPLTRVTASTKS